VRARGNRQRPGCCPHRPIGPGRRLTRSAPRPSAQGPRRCARRRVTSTVMLCGSRPTPPLGLSVASPAQTRRQGGMTRPAVAMIAPAPGQTTEVPWLEGSVRTCRSRLSSRPQNQSLGSHVHPGVPGPDDLHAPASVVRQPSRLDRLGVDRVASVRRRPLQYHRLNPGSRSRSPRLRPAAVRTSRRGGPRAAATKRPSRRTRSDPGLVSGATPP
jgi:hypothetical protein